MLLGTKTTEYVLTQKRLTACCVKQAGSGPVYTKRANSNTNLKLKIRVLTILAILLLLIWHPSSIRSCKFGFVRAKSTSLFCVQHLFKKNDHCDTPSFPVKTDTITLEQRWTIGNCSCQNSKWPSWHMTQRSVFNHRGDRGFALLGKVHLSVSSMLLSMPQQSILKFEFA